MFFFDQMASSSIASATLTISGTYYLYNGSSIYCTARAYSYAGRITGYGSATDCYTDSLSDMHPKSLTLLGCIS